MKRISWTLLATAALAFSTCLPAQAGGGFGRRGRPEVAQQERPEPRRERQEQARPEQGPDVQGPRRERQGQQRPQVPVEQLRHQVRQRVMHLRQQAERLQQLRQHARRGDGPQMGRGPMQPGRPQAGRRPGPGGGRAWQQQGGGMRHRPGMAGPGFRGGRAQSGCHGGRGANQPPAWAMRGRAAGKRLPNEVREQMRERGQRAVESFRAPRQPAGRRGGDRSGMGAGGQRHGRQFEA